MNVTTIFIVYEENHLQKNRTPNYREVEIMMMMTTTTTTTTTMMMMMMMIIIMIIKGCHISDCSSQACYQGVPGSFLGRPFRN